MNDIKEERRYLSTKETARLLGVSELTIFRWVKKGNIPSYRFGRKRFFDKYELAEWIKKQKEGG